MEILIPLVLIVVVSFSSARILSTSDNTEPTCATYGGVHNENACCAASCGTCGGSGCHSRPGGVSNCCAGGIPLQQVCGPEQDAPCFLKISVICGKYGAATCNDCGPDPKYCSGDCAWDSTMSACGKV